MGLGWIGNVCCAGRVVGWKVRKLELISCLTFSEIYVSRLFYMLFGLCNLPDSFWISGSCPLAAERQLARRDP